jgi:hypothetical protein
VLHFQFLNFMSIDLNSLKNHGADELAEGMFRMADETMLLPMDEKLKFEQGDAGNSFGFVETPAMISAQYCALQIQSRRS